MVWEKASHIPKGFGPHFVGHNLMIVTTNPALPMALHIPTLYDYAGVRKRDSSHKDNLVPTLDYLYNLLSNIYGY